MSSLSRPRRVRSAGSVREGARGACEDSFLTVPSFGFAGIADGMGGMQGGEVASALAVHAMVEVLEPLCGQPVDFQRDGANLSMRALDETCKRVVRDVPLQTPTQQTPEHWFVAALRAANTRIISCGTLDFRYKGIGTTAALCFVGEDEVTIAHCGDSRVYRWRAGVLEQLTRDHSLVEEWGNFSNGTQPALTPEQKEQYQHILVRALGVNPVLAVDVRIELWEPNDVFLLATDGFWRVVAEKEISALLHSHAHDPKSACAALLAAAERNKTTDDATVCLLATGAIEQ